MCRTVIVALLAVIVAAAPARAEDDHLKCYTIKDGIKVSGLADLGTSAFGADPGCTISKAQLFCVTGTETSVAVTDKTTGAPITPLPAP